MPLNLHELLGDSMKRSTNMQIVNWKISIIFLVKPELISFKFVKLIFFCDQ